MNKFDEAKNLLEKLSAIITSTEQLSANIVHNVPQISHNSTPQVYFYSTSSSSGPSVQYPPTTIRFAAGNKRRKGPTKNSSQQKTAKFVPWSHVFVCLADTDADRVPSD